MAEEDLNQSPEQNVELKSEEGSERRKSVRRVLRTTAVVILNESQTFEVRTVDVSINGMAIVAPANPKPGVVFYIRFKVPLKNKGYENFESKARVVHSIYSSSESGFKIGLNFIQLPQNFATLLEKFIE